MQGEAEPVSRRADVETVRRAANGDIAAIKPRKTA
jgi:hypothetical protein